MKIAIDLNDVVRDYTNNFIRYYVQNYNHEFDLDELEVVSDDYQVIFPFKSDMAYQKFVYDEFSYELFGKCPLCTKNLESEIRIFVSRILPNLDTDEQIEVMFFSGKEYGNSMGSTMSFLAKLNCDVREIYLPTDSLTIWDRSDIVISASPNVLNNKPEGKVSIKIRTDYNKDCESDYSFSTLSNFITDEDKIKKILIDERK